jgi:hypothetical protein
LGFTVDEVKLLGAARDQCHEQTQLVQTSLSYALEAIGEPMKMQQYYAGNTHTYLQYSPALIDHKLAKRVLNKITFKGGMSLITTNRSAPFSTQYEVVFTIRAVSACASDTRWFYTLDDLSAARRLECYLRNKKGKTAYVPSASLIHKIKLNKRCVFKGGATYILGLTGRGIWFLLNEE